MFDREWLEKRINRRRGAGLLEKWTSSGKKMEEAWCEFGERLRGEVERIWQLSEEHEGNKDGSGGGDGGSTDGTKL